LASMESLPVQLLIVAQIALRRKGASDKK